MRNILILIFLIISNVFAFNQELSIKLSIDFEKDTAKTCNPFHIWPIPYLTITYSNISDHDIYFKKIICSERTFPCFLSVNNDNNIYNSLYNKNIDKIFTVKTINDDYFCDAWEVFKDTEVIKIEHLIDPVNDDLYIINNKLLNFCNKDTTLISPSISDFIFNTPYESVSLLNSKYNFYYINKNNNIELNKNTILDYLKNYFIFLEVNKSFVDRINLSAFYIAGGIYSFDINKISLKDNILGFPKWDKQENSWIYQRVYFPSKIMNYILYSGNVKFNIAPLILNNPPR
jgi:hypothetical protein